jgi:23S rRNA (pseudouridine1915-N3)-methyltransferase
MRLIIAAVGRVHTAPEQELCDLYCERARGIGAKLGFSKVDLVLAETSRAGTAIKRMQEEASRLTAKLASATHRIALDEAGRAVTSEAFARHLAKLRDSGVRDLAFLIGGPDGLAPALKESVNERLAFGPETWPHLFVRAMLAEQIYRAFAILSGHPYHRGAAR